MGCYPYARFGFIRARPGVRVEIVSASGLPRYGGCPGQTDRHHTSRLRSQNNQHLFDWNSQLVGGGLDDGILLIILYASFLFFPGKITVHH